MCSAAEKRVMAISVQCGECLDTFRVRDELAGKKTRCGSCGGTILV
jgi:DNA-directed RNA polymerase subunit RPC12/RpoP